MLTDSLWKNILGYIGWAMLAVLVGVLQEVHRQLASDLPVIEWYAILDAAIVATLSVLVVMLGTMKQPSIGHEPIARKVDAHEDRLQVTDDLIQTLPPRVEVSH